MMSNSLTKASYYDGLAGYPAEHCVRILNPLSNDLSVMRQTLLFNALEAVQLNVNHRNADLKLYEYGNCYFYDPAKKEEGGLAPYSERAKVSMTVTGNDRQPSWNVAAQPAGFFTLRAMAEKAMLRFGLDLNAAETEPLESDLYSEAIACRWNGKKLLRNGHRVEKDSRACSTSRPTYTMRNSTSTRWSGSRGTTRSRSRNCRNIPRSVATWPCSWTRR